MATLLHARQQSVTELDHRQHQHLHEALMFGPVHAGQMPGHTVTGVVDEDVDVQLLRGDLADQLADRIGSSQIGGDAVHADAVLLLQLGGQLLQAIQTAGGQYQIVALRRQLAGEFGTDAGRGTGDQRG